MNVVNMGQETFNDALFYLDNARRDSNDGKNYSMWRNCRAALFSMCLSAESDLLKLIAICIRRKPEDKRSRTERKILDYLTNPSKADKPVLNEIKTISQKYSLLLTLNEKSDTEVPEYYTKATHLRNKVTHYSFSKNEYVYSDSILTEVEEALGGIRKFVKHIWRIAGDDYPFWVDMNHSISIDIEESTGIEVDTKVIKYRKIRRNV